MAKSRPISAPRAEFETMMFPYKGIDRSAMHTLPPEGTTRLARNVRPTPGSTDRFGGGKRPGLAKLFTTQAEGEYWTNGDTQINHIAAVPKVAANTNSNAGSTAETVTETFVDDTMRAHPDPTDLGTDLVVFRRDYITGSPHRVQSNPFYRAQKTDLSGTAGNALLESDNGGLVLDWLDTANGGYPGVAVLYNTTNDITMAMYASRQATTGGNAAGAQGEPIGMGPFIRGSADLSQCIAANLIRTAANTIRLDIIQINGATRTTLASSDTFVLDGTAWNATTQALSDLTIRLHEVDGAVSATCTWVSAGIGTGSSASLRVTSATTTYNTFTRAGICAAFTAGGAPADVNSRWYIRSITYTKLVPKSNVILNSCTRNETPWAGSLGRYFVPIGCRSLSVTTAGTISTAGAANGTGWASDSVAGVTYPYINSDYPVVAGNTAASMSSLIEIEDINVTSVRPQVEVRGRRDRFLSIDSGSDTEDICGAALRIAGTYAPPNIGQIAAILIEVMHGADFTTYMNYGRQDHFTQIRFVGLVNGARYVLDTFDVTTDHMPPFRADVYQRFHDNGENTIATMTVSWKINGITIKTWMPSSMAGWAAFIAAANAASLTTAMNTSRRCGICFRGDDAPPPNWYAFGGRIVDTTNEDSTAQITEEYNGDVYVFTRGRVYRGSSSGGALIGVGGGGFANPSICTAYFGRYLFGVDGGALPQYIDLQQTSLAYAISPWPAAVTAGTLPENCRLICEFLGRMVLANQPDTPNLFYMSRAGDPFDWDYGADPAESSAIAASSGGIGIPPEPITALVRGQEDYLLIGGPSRIQMIVGDPGFGGRMVQRTSKVGIFGPRAWCFDDQNRLFFIGGSGGLWVMSATGDPINVDRGRWGDEITKIDGSTHFVQMVFDPVDRLIYILKSSAIKSGANVHFVYDVAGDSCWEDTYDSGGTAPYMNPWAVGQVDTSVANDRRVLFGGQDGYVRRMTDAAAYDADTADGESPTQLAIPCEVDIYPKLQSPQSESMAHELQATLDENLEGVTAYWFTSDSAQAVAEQVIGAQISSASLVAGYNRPVSIRSRGAAHKLKIYQSSNTDRFAIENLAVSMSYRSRRR